MSSRSAWACPASTSSWSARRPLARQTQLVSPSPLRDSRLLHSHSHLTDASATVPLLSPHLLPISLSPSPLSLGSHQETAGLQHRCIARILQGLSYRRRSVMLDLTRAIACIDWRCDWVELFPQRRTGNETGISVEDTYFAHQLYERRHKYAHAGQIAGSKQSSAFSKHAFHGRSRQQPVVRAQSMGLHQASTLWAHPQQNHAVLPGTVEEQHDQAGVVDRNTQTRGRTTTVVVHRTRAAIIGPFTRVRAIIQ